MGRWCEQKRPYSDSGGRWESNAASVGSRHFASAVEHLRHPQRGVRMDVRRRNVLKLLLSSAATGALSSKGAAASEGSSIRRDVCVIGGGSAGTYAALRLRDEG